MGKVHTPYKDCSINRSCNTLANQYLILVTIFAAIISSEIEDDEELGILGSFLVALGEELALSSEIRIVCKEKLEEGEEESEFDVIEDVFDRGISSSKSRPKKIKKTRRKIVKRDSK